MAKTRCIILPDDDAARIQEYLSTDINKKHVQKNGSMISHSVQFPDGFSVRLTCCGVPSGVSYAEAILCDQSGEEVASSGPQSEILDYWWLPFNGREYALSVSAGPIREEPGGKESHCVSCGSMSKHIRRNASQKHFGKSLTPDKT